MATPGSRPAPGRNGEPQSTPGWQKAEPVSPSFSPCSAFSVVSSRRGLVRRRSNPSLTGGRFFEIFVIPQLSAGRRAAQSWNVMGRMPMPRHVTTRPFSRSSLRLCPALAGLAPVSPVPLCAFAPLRYIPLPFFLPARPYTPESEGLHGEKICCGRCVAMLLYEEEIEVFSVTVEKYTQGGISK